MPKTITLFEGTGRTVLVVVLSAALLFGAGAGSAINISADKGELEVGYFLSGETGGGAALGAAMGGYAGCIAGGVASSPLGPGAVAGCSAGATLGGGLGGF
jgi:hypothetical protein